MQEVAKESPADFHAERMTQRSRILTGLYGGRIADSDLAAAVRYFLDGPGKNLPRPCCRCEWKDLLIRTGVRRLPLSPKDLNGEFRSC